MLQPQELGFFSKLLAAYHGVDRFSRLTSTIVQHQRVPRSCNDVKARAKACRDGLILTCRMQG